MIKEFASRSPKAASALIYVAGYVAGSLLGVLIGYVVSGSVRSGPAIGFGGGCGLLALFLAQRKGLVPEPDELNKPITLFGADSWRNNTLRPGGRQPGAPE